MTAYNFRLILLNKNLQTYEERMEHEEFGEFFYHKDKWLGCTMAKVKEDTKRFKFCFPVSPLNGVTRRR